MSDQVQSPVEKALVEALCGTDEERAISKRIARLMSRGGSLQAEHRATGDDIQLFTNTRIFRQEIAEAVRDFEALPKLSTAGSSNLAELKRMLEGFDKTLLQYTTDGRA